MGFLGATLGKFTSALGGAPAAGGVIVTGLVVGVIAGASAGGAFTGPAPSASPAEAAVYPCPNMGPELITVKSGQRVLVIGKSADGQWFEILYPSGALKSAWVQASAYALIGDASTNDVPVTECYPAEVTALAAAPAESMSDVGSFEPTPPPTPTPTPKPTPTPTPPPTPTPRATPVPRATPRPTAAPTAKPTPPPDTTGPTWVRFSANEVQCQYINVVGAVTDNVGVTAVTLHWTDPAGAQHSSDMDPAGSDTWSGQITARSGIGGNWSIYAVASDKAGNTSKSQTRDLLVHC